MGNDMDEDYSVLIYTDITDGAEENMADMSGRIDRIDPLYKLQYKINHF
jgi:hypothetical protein